ncbi:kinesin family protein-like protein [Rhizodiscina lignyota]|uniref:Kinesin family protein-like protein n=1 Tax=Rhizodiscina lignyota TaxID=1504668 RepID=A0A9P4IM17_9PEZI|nr:kinesin family protein-like protein [Rhizodiscina lignyota]
MSVRVIARIRPPGKAELEKDTIVTVDSANDDTNPNILKIPNPKNEAELFSFQFNSVYDQHATQQQLFENEVSPTVKHLFGGFDVTLFAYGVTGTGKTHTMRGGKSLADRGVIPRLLSAIYRRARKIEKDSGGDKQVEVAMSYYEIYNDRVFDLFEPPEKRTPAGLPIRDNGGKTVVVGLTERPCTTLKEFEYLYDQANVNRSTSATKLNAHSSRSHAILCVKLTQISDSHTLVSTASAIDLAGSEDNRRTDNNRERLVESASINKSLFVLAQCVEAISKKQSRIPYRESKMTRILSLGQNNGLTIMILNLAPSRSYHQDTLSSLNFANRTKKIEVNEIENEPVFGGPGAVTKATASITGPSIQRQPLRAISVASHNVHVGANEKPDKTDKLVKAFSVYSDKQRSQEGKSQALSHQQKRTDKRTLDIHGTSSRPSKLMRPSESVTRSSKFAAGAQQGLSQELLEDLISRRIDEKLAEKALEAQSQPTQALPEDLQRRLDALEQRVSEKEDGSRGEGLQFLLMAKQHVARGENSSALRMYELALPYFKGNEKLEGKIRALKEKIEGQKSTTQSLREDPCHDGAPELSNASPARRKRKAVRDDSKDDDYDEGQDVLGEDDDCEDEHCSKPKSRATTKPKTTLRKPALPSPDTNTFSDPLTQTPRTAHLLQIINTRDISQIRGLKGVGAKRAEAIVGALCEMDVDDITDLAQLGALKGVGLKTVENMRTGVGCI